MKKLIQITSILCVFLWSISCSEEPAKVVDNDVKKEIDVKEIIDTEDIYIISDYQLSTLYTCNSDKTQIDDSILEFSQSDAQLLMSIARSEGGEGIEGQLWVMCVLCNRLEDDSFADNLRDIVYEKNQFEVVLNGKYKSADINDNTHIALALLESGYNPSQGALYFESKTNSDHSWHKKNLTFIKEVEGNLFYK